MGLISYTIPVAGSTLNSIADPELATALQTILTWANGNVDTSNLSSTAAIKGTQLASNAGILGSQLASNAGIVAAQLAVGAFTWMSFTSSGVSVGASANQLVKMTAGGTTVTLPSPATDARVGVVATGSVSGASPVTVAAASGLIYGVGCSGVSSVLLGASNAAVILQSDGTNWYVISGQQDTGWVALAYASSWNSTAGGYVAGYRVIGNMAYLRGVAQNNTGGASNVPFQTFPSILRPQSTVNVLCFQAALSVVSVLGITSAGANSVVPSPANATSVQFDGISYSLS